MSEDQDRASIEMVRLLVHRADRNNGAPSCKCPECTAIKRVCTLAGDAINMKAARERKRIRQLREGESHL